MSNLFKDIAVDPITQEEILSYADDALESVVEELNKDDDFDPDEVDLGEFAKFFFYNGFITGARLTASDPELRDAVNLMNEEIAYQVKE